MSGVILCDLSGSGSNAKPPVIRGGCPCGWWAVSNCLLMQSPVYAMCHTAEKDRPVVSGVAPQEPEQGEANDEAGF